MDLFGHCPVPGLQTFPDILTREEIERLEHRVQGMTLKPYEHGEWIANRLVAHYSCPTHQAYSDDTIHDIPRWMIGVRNRIVAAAGLAPRSFIQFSVSVYPPGAGIGWHRDMPPFRRIIGVSIGAPSTMRFRQKTPEGAWRRYNLPLTPGCVYAITQDARSRWEHSIAPVKAWRASFTTRDID